MTRNQPHASSRGEHTRRQGGERDERKVGREILRRSPMMAYLLDAMEAGKDIGHYGRLTFAMVARFFLPEADLLDLLSHQPDQDAEKARAMLRQIQERNYNPPRRERILEWQSRQEFPILPHPDDPNSGNVYQDLQFPDDIYNQIEEFWEERTETKTGA
jgi:hypothetical protein